MNEKHVPTFYGGNQLLVSFAFMLLSTLAFSQDLKITGKVTAANGSPLSGVTVKVKEKQTATTTNEDGNFAIDAQKGQTLVLSYVGYALKEVPIRNNTNLEVNLQPSDNDLDEVVVVGYGSRRKRDITSAVSTVNMADIGEQPSRGITQLIQGQAPGVVVKQKDGKPGAGFEVRVRGIASLGAGSEPLYVIDGFAMGTNTGVNINPNDIESISILKDAAATAIYGARGSNGVVLITTRTAKEGQTHLNFSVDFGIQNIPKSRRVKVLNGPEFAQFKKKCGWIMSVISKSANLSKAKFLLASGFLNKPNIQQIGLMRSFMIMLPTQTIISAFPPVTVRLNRCFQSVITRRKVPSLKPIMTGFLFAPT